VGVSITKLSALLYSLLLSVYHNRSGVNNNELLVETCFDYSRRCTMSESRRLTKLSKFLSLILRHQPERFALAIDEEGWASLSEVMEILNGLPNFRWATRAGVMQVVEEGSGDDKRRFEVAENRIRARYGHSFDQPIRYEPCVPPPVLYHGTSRRSLAAICQEGVCPMGRQYVHLSPDPETAARVGARHDEQPVILTVRAADAHAAGVVFHQADEAVYLAKRIPAEFVGLPGE
jgi:putative RNA 2'-phosphotransferase